MEASYVGSRTNSLQTSRSINEVSATDLQRGSALVTQVTNPFKGLLPGTSFNGATVTQQQLLRPFPQFDTITEALHNVGYATYDSLQVRVERRFSHGLAGLLSYTRSKNLEAVNYLNPQDGWNPAKTLTSFDAPNRLTLSVNYELPFLKTSRNLAGQILGGWQTNLITTFQSGLPVDAPGTAFATGADPRSTNRSRDQWFNPCTLTVAGARQNCSSANQTVAWMVQPSYTLRTLSFRLPSVRTYRDPILDASIFKTFRFTSGSNCSSAQRHSTLPILPGSPRPACPLMPRRLEWSLLPSPTIRAIFSSR